MVIKRTSQLSGKYRERDIPGVTPKLLERWESGGLIQNVFPFLSEDDREFIMTGITPEEWEELFGESYE